MEGTYDVNLGDVKIGTVTVTRQGLYYVISSQCTLSGEVMYDLVVSSDGRQEKLGLLIPEAERYSLSVKIPSKKLGQGTPAFFVRPRHDSAVGEFISIHPDEPFAYLHRLERAYLVRREQQLGVCFYEAE